MAGAGIPLAVLKPQAQQHTDPDEQHKAHDVVPAEHRRRGPLCIQYLQHTSPEHISPPLWCRTNHLTLDVSIAHPTEKGNKSYKVVTILSGQKRNSRSSILLSLKRKCYFVHYAKRHFKKTMLYCCCSILFLVIVAVLSALQ